MQQIDLELYIQIKDGLPYEHPILAENMKMAFPDVDLDNLPETFAKFIRTEKPIPSTYEVYEGSTYELQDGIVNEIHHIRQMNDQERLEKTQKVREYMDEAKANRILFINKILQEELNEYEAFLWSKCLHEHENWQIESVDPIMPRFPKFPRKDEDGKWIAP